MPRPDLRLNLVYRMFRWIVFTERPWYIVIVHTFVKTPIVFCYISVIEGLPLEPLGLPLD